MYCRMRPPMLIKLAEYILILGSIRCSDTSEDCVYVQHSYTPPTVITIDDQLPNSSTYTEKNHSHPQTRRHNQASFSYRHHPYVPEGSGSKALENTVITNTGIPSFPDNKPPHKGPSSSIRPEQRVALELKSDTVTREKPSNILSIDTTDQSSEPTTSHRATTARATKTAAKDSMDPRNLRFQIFQNLPDWFLSESQSHEAIEYWGKEARHVRTTFAKTADALFIRLLYLISSCEAWHCMKFEWDAAIASFEVGPKVSRISLMPVENQAQVNCRTLRTFIANTTSEQYRFQSDTAALFLNLAGAIRSKAFPGSQYSKIKPNPLQGLNFTANIERPYRMAMVEITNTDPTYLGITKLALITLVSQVFNHALLLNEMFSQLLLIANRINDITVLLQKVIGHKATKLSDGAKPEYLSPAFQRAIISDLYKEEELIKWTESQLNSSLTVLHILVQYMPGVLNQTVSVHPVLLNKVRTIFWHYLV